MKLREIAYTRSGDKGYSVNVCVFVYREEDWPILRDRLTAEKVKAYFHRTVLGEVERYELPVLQGLNFMLNDALSGAYSTSLAVDSQGKSYQSFMLDIEL